MNFNPMDLLKNFQNMQSNMGDIQEQIKNVEATGNAGGGLVEIKINGQMEVQSIKLDPLCVDSRDVKMLEDLVQAAFNSAMVNVKAKLQTELAGKMNIPPGMGGV